MKQDAVIKLLLVGAACLAVAVFWWLPVFYVRAYESRIPDLSAVDDRSGGIWLALLQTTLGASVYGSVAFVRLQRAASHLDDRMRRRFLWAGIVLLTGAWSWWIWPLIVLFSKAGSGALNR